MKNGKPPEAGSSSNPTTEISETIHLKKQIGLLEGVAIILGIIFGSGIFVAPKGIIDEVKAVGTALVVWGFCGILSTIGAICYAELGLIIPKSGGDYAYIYEVYGSLLAFLYMWDAVIVFVPATNAIMGLTFATHVLQPFFPYGCKMPDNAIKLLAGLSIFLLTFINCYSIKGTTILQNIIMFTRTGALIMIIVIGIVWMYLGHLEHFQDPFIESERDFKKYSVAFYSGMFAYSGFHYLNFMTEELKNPYRDLPRAIYISLPIATVTYLLCNMAYFAVLTTEEISNSDAVAVLFGQKVLGSYSAIISILVAISAFGGLCVHIMVTSRTAFAGAQNSHMPSILAHVNINKFSPMPALVFLSLQSIVLLYCADVIVLITYCTIIETVYITLSIAIILHYRRKFPDKPRPIKVNILLPITFIVISIVLLIIPCFIVPFQVLAGILITIIGLPFYYIFVKWKNKPKWLRRFLVRTTIILQKFFVTVMVEEEHEQLI